MKPLSGFMTQHGKLADLTDPETGKKLLPWNVPKTRCGGREEQPKITNTTAGPGFELRPGIIYP